jgi:hypothetical protein
MFYGQGIWFSYMWIGCKFPNNISSWDNFDLCPIFLNKYHDQILLYG